jgi:hypothetical protein
MDRQLWIREIQSVALAMLRQQKINLQDVVVDDRRQIVSVGNLFFAQGDDASFLCTLCPDDVDDRIYLVYFLIGAGSLPEVKLDKLAVRGF